MKIEIVLKQEGPKTRGVLGVIGNESLQYSQLKIKDTTNGKMVIYKEPKENIFTQQ